MERRYEAGAAVVFLDSHGQRHNALVTCWWGVGKTFEGGRHEPGCNLLIVSGDENQEDNYGRQIQRQSSVVHKSIQPANGMAWLWPDE